MGNSLESSVSLFEEWDGLAETIEMGEICEDIEEYLEPLQRGEVVSSLASGIKSILEAVSVGSIAVMQLMQKGSPDETIDSDSDEMENSLKKSSEALVHDFSKL